MGQIVMRGNQGTCASNRNMKSVGIRLSVCGIMVACMHCPFMDLTSRNTQAR